MSALRHRSGRLAEPRTTVRSEGRKRIQLACCLLNMSFVNSLGQKKW